MNARYPVAMHSKSNDLAIAPAGDASDFHAGIGPRSDPSVHSHHDVSCPYCRQRFDLFAAAWCRHGGEPSKVCARCGRCLCEHPLYGEGRFWNEAPRGFQRHGFRRLFLLYV